MSKFYQILLVFLISVTPYFVWADYNIIPQPQSVKMDSEFINVNQITEDFKTIIVDSTIPPEGYQLKISPGGIQIRVSDDTGTFYANQTLDQIIGTAQNEKIQCGSITDFPKVPYRALLLDGARQYHSIETLKRGLRMMAQLKINTLHWHLTEGMGWRIPIKAFPELTKVGAYVGTLPEQQGFYSTEYIKEIVDYAQKLHITIVPEIDIPGHAEAALRAYPQWSCQGQKPPAQMGFSDVIFCAGKDTVREALKTILTETAELFPGPYIHIGGDEAPKGKWKQCKDCQHLKNKLKLNDFSELQMYLTNELVAHVAKLGKQAIVWNDGIHYTKNIEPCDSIIVQYWQMRGDKKGDHLRRIQQSKNPYIYSPNALCYINYPEKPWKGYGKDRTLTFEQCYQRASFPEGRAPMGAVVALWTDYNLVTSMLDERTFDRIYILAELMWRGEKTSSIESFRKRIQAIDPLITRWVSPK